VSPAELVDKWREQAAEFARTATYSGNGDQAQLERWRRHYARCHARVATYDECAADLAAALESGES